MTGIINKSALEDIEGIHPPLLLQRQFAARAVETRLTQIDQAASRRRLDDLFQSMLNQAFNLFHIEMFLWQLSPILHHQRTRRHQHHSPPRHSRRTLRRQRLRNRRPAPRSLELNSSRRDPQIRALPSIQYP